MGTQQNKGVKALSKWEWVENDNGVEIYRNKQDGIIAERRRVTLIGSYILSEQNKVYAFRSNNPFGLVKSYETIEIQDLNKQKEKIGDLCKCGGEKIQLDVYTERIQYRLSQLPQLTFLEGLFILKQTVPAFQVAYQKVGGLHINPELIGITDKGEVRAWVNENWAINRPSHIIPILKSSSRKEYFDTVRPEFRDQSQMINNLIGVVSQKTEKGHFPQPFAEQLKARAVNFRTTKKFLNEYITINNITLPTQINKNKVAVKDQNTLEPSFIRSNSYKTSVSVSALSPQPIQSSYQAPKFSFNNASYQAKFQNRPNPLKVESITSYEYKPSTSVLFSTNPQPSLTFNTYSSQMPLSFNPEIKEVVSNYKPFVPQTNADGQPFKFNELKFNLLQHIQPEPKPLQVKPQPMSSDYISKPESPLFKLNQLAQNEEQMSHHNASYKIISSHEGVLEA